MHKNRGLEIHIKDYAHILGALEQGSVSLIRASAVSGGNNTNRAFLDAFSPFLHKNGLVLTDDSNDNAPLVSALYAHYGKPFTLAISESPYSQSKQIMLFGKNHRLYQKNHAPFKLLEIESLLSKENRKFRKKRNSRTSDEGISKLRNEVLASAKTLSSSVNPTLAQEIRLSTDMTTLELPISATKSRFSLPHHYNMSIRKVAAENTLTERMGKPEGLSVHQKESNIPVAVLEYLVVELLEPTSFLLDLNSVTGDLGHAVVNILDENPKLTYSCITQNDEQESLAVDRLESISSGAWKNWTYHKPTNHPFVTILE